MSAVVQMDTNGARRLTERIRMVAVTLNENVDKLKQLVTEAKESGAHTALGYVSWPAYLADVLGETPLRLERDVRQELTAELSRQGMSTRAIAPILGVTHETVAQDIKAPVRNLTPPEPDPLADASTGEILEPEPPHAITGLDGKTYAAPAPGPKPQRKALTDSAKDIGWELRKATEKLQKLTEDDRYTRNKEEVAAHIRGHLLFAVEICNQLLNTFTEQEN